MQKLKRMLSDLGPGIILAATGVGVGDMVSATIAGAEYGMVLVWALAAGVLLKWAITEGLARWQLATDTTLMQGWRDHLPSPISIAFFAYFLVWTYIVSSALVAASAMVPAAIFPEVSQPIWGLVHAVLAFVLVYYGNYERLVDIMKFFIGLMFTCVVTTNLLILRTGARWTVAEPSDFSLGYTLSIIGGVGGTVTLLSYGYWIKEQKWSGAARMSSVRNDLGLSFSLVLFFSLCMMFLSTQIDWQTEVLNEGPELCLLLANRIAEETGAAGRFIFLVGFWGAAYSSVLGVWHGVPFLFDDWVHLWRRRSPQGQTGKAYRGYLLYMTLAAISVLYLQRPVWLIYVYTVVGSLFFPFVISTLLWMNNKADWVTSRLRNRMAVNVVLIVGLLLYIYLGVRNFL